MPLARGKRQQNGKMIVANSAKGKSMALILFSFLKMLSICLLGRVTVAGCGGTSTAWDLHPQRRGSQQDAMTPKILNISTWLIMAFPLSIQL